MDGRFLYFSHCAGGPALEAVPDGEGRWRARCPACAKGIVVQETPDVPSESEQEFAEGGEIADVPAGSPEDLVRVEPIDPLADASPADRLRILLDSWYGMTDRVRAIETLCRSWYHDIVEAEDDAMHRVTDLFVAGDHVYVTLETGEGEVRFDARGVLVSKPTLMFVWTLAWGPGTRFVRELETCLLVRFGNVAPPTTDDLEGFWPVLAWWSPSLWRVGFWTAITPTIDGAQVAAAVRATRHLARRVASLAIDPATLAPPPADEG